MDTQSIVVSHAVSVIQVWNGHSMAVSHAVSAIQVWNGWYKT